LATVTPDGTDEREYITIGVANKINDYKFVICSSNEQIDIQELAIA